jgi:hypothetical protein
MTKPPRRIEHPVRRNFFLSLCSTYQALLKRRREPAAFLFLSFDLVENNKNNFSKKSKNIFIDSISF